MTAAPRTGWRARIAGAIGLVTGFWNRRQRDERLDEEIQFHLEMEAERNRRDGLSPEAAQRAARMAFGGEAQVRAEAVDEIRSSWLAALGHDVRYAVRTLRRTPGFTAVAIATLALGIGATTVFFSVVDHVVLRPLPYPEPDRLVLIRERIEQLSDRYPLVDANAAHFLEWRRRCGACGTITAARGASVTLTNGADPERVGALRVSADVFPTLGAQPALGRLFSADEDVEGGPRVAILSDGLWRRLGADPLIVGRTVTLNDTPWEVIGVTERGFHYPGGAGHGIPRVIDLYLPLALSAHERTTPGEYQYSVIAKLPPNGTIEQARAELGGIAAELSRASPAGFTLSALVTPLKTAIVGTSSRPLLLLLGAVGAVLVIVCVNLAHLLLARNLARTREWALRVAIGAHPTRLVRQTLTESLVLAVAGGGAGIVLSQWGLAALLRRAPIDLPRLGEITLDARVLTVSLLLSIVVGVSFGALPALRSSRTAPADALKGGGRGHTEGRRSLTGRAALIGAQAALCAALLAMTGLLLSSLVRVQRVDTGFAPMPALALDLSLPPAQFADAERRIGFFDALLDNVGAAPGVRAAALTTLLPLEGEAQIEVLSWEHDSRPAATRPVANIRYVSPAYFSVAGTPIRRGRAFTNADRGTAVVVLSARTAETLWPGEDPLGKRVVPGSNDSAATVIGVAGDIRARSPEQESNPAAYLPYWSLNTPTAMTLVVAADGDPSRLTAAARQAVRASGTGVAISKVRTVDAVIAAATASRRFQLMVFVWFGITALVTAAVGIYGVVSHAVGQRRSEIGIRLALGARPAEVRRRVIRDGLVPVAAGLALGLGATVAFGGILAGLLFGVRVSDPLTLAAVAAVILAVAAAACWLPARRATGIDTLQRALSD
ncbi:MAG: ADOP family duplicated permease [Gemmatimonadales bacterium]